MLRSIIIEDQAPAQHILQKYISKVDKLVLEKTFSDALEAKGYLEKNPVDLVFLDINLPRLSGMDFLRTSGNHRVTILTTAYSEFALESYQYNVADYLLKPFSFERFSQAIEKVMMITHSQPMADPNHTQTGKPIYIRCSHDLVKVKSEEIILIKSDSDYTEVITITQKYLTLDSLKEWSARLAPEFVQVHKSFIINLNHLQKISHSKIHLAKDYVVPVGRVFKKSLMKNVGERG